LGYVSKRLTTLSVEERAAGARQAAPVLDSFIDEQLARFDLAEEQLALVGFSQGTMMALHVGPRRERQIAGIVGYSGMLAIRMDSLPTFAASRPCCSSMAMPTIYCRSPPSIRRRRRSTVWASI
jgi:phospholipase/carboxylesterase